MECRREQHTRSQDPEEGALRAESPQCRPAHHAQHDHRGRISWTPGAGDDRFQKGERSLHEAPMLGVGTQAGEELRARAGVRQIQAHEDHTESDEEARPQPAGQRGQGRQRRELGESRQRSGHPRRGGGSGEEDQEYDPEEAERLQMRVPGHLHHQKGRPEVEDLCESSAAAGDASYLAQEPSRAQIESQPEELRLEDGSTRHGDDEERHLGEGRIDGIYAGVVDEAVPPRSELCQCGVGGGEQVGIHTGELDMAVPQIPVYVVGQLRRQGQEYQTQPDGHHPDDDVAAHRVEDSAGRNGVHGEGRREQDHPHPREGRPWPPAQGTQQRKLRDGRRHQEPPGLPTDWERR